ncbi:hypothetical protein NEIFLAOT_01814, partial [Neisseria flavescens NRL30031/H210]
TGGAKDPESRANIREALISVYRLDKSVYGLYKSAEEHTKIRTKKSKLLIMFPLVLCLIGYGIWSFSGFWSRFEGEAPSADKTTEAVTTAENAPTTTQTPQETATGRYETQTIQAEQPKPYISEDDYKPRIDNRPETAPIYDGMNKAVKTMPWPSACVKSDNGCNCYTDQGTKIKEIDKKTCISYIKDGLPFNPYKAKQLETAATAAPAEQHETPQVLTMGGKSQQNLMYDGYNDNAMSNQGGKVN